MMVAANGAAEQVERIGKLVDVDVPAAQVAHPPVELETRASVQHPPIVEAEHIARLEAQLREVLV